MVRLPFSSSAVAVVVCAFALVVPEVASRHLGQRSSDQACRCFPGDACWPTETEWDQFNQTLGGKLVATIPIAHSCHGSSFGPYDAEACAQLQSVWGLPETHYTTSSSPMAAFFANASCDPFTPQSAECVIGTQIQYAVKASSASDYQTAIAFAQERNIRLVIRNTGHDFLGKSTGAGALGIWTHHLKNIQILDYKSKNYSGKAIKIGAGVQIFEAQAAAHAQGLAVVGGNCPSVGLAGGYTQGGGHGPLASTFGLAADQVLEWEVITATGEHLVATPSNHSDLYWALSGGGGGTFAAVLSMTAKAYPDLKVTSANLTFTSSGVSEDTFFDVVQTYLMSLPSIVDTGATSIWLLANGLFLMQPTTAPGMTQAELQALLEPTLTKLRENSMPYDFHIQEFPTYLDSYTAMNPPPNVTEYNVGSRFIPRSLVASNDSAASLIDALRFIVNSGAVVSGVSLNVSRGASDPPNSINPAWRSTLFSAVFGLPYDRSDFEANIALQQQVTDILVPKLEALTPDGGAYLNEADRNQPNFQKVFYGENYATLRAIKKKYDPSSTFYALKAVGSEEWDVKSDGRLCKVE